MATVVRQTDGGPTCSICLGELNTPRQLPCTHSFCQSCLQSYITGKATEHEKMRCIECPVCRHPTGHFKQNESTSDWASLFPADTVLQSMLPTKSKVDRVCDVCNSEGAAVTATGFCAVCKEAMCDNCLRVHRKQKMSKSHTIITNEDFMNNLQHVMKSAECFTCSEHGDEDLKFYCNNHKIACCGICFLESHKACSDVKMLKDELPALLGETKISQIIEELKRLETHLKNVIDIKESNVNDLDSQVKRLTDEIREMKRKINTVLEEIEKKVMLEGRKIHKEVVINIQEENHQCLSLIHAIRHSQLLCETVHKYGIDIQKFLTAEKLKSQLPLYYSQIREKYEKTETLALHVNFTPLLESLLSLSSSDGKLVAMTVSPIALPDLRKPTSACQIEKVETFDVNTSGRRPSFTGITILPRDRMMLVDNNNRQCILLDNSHQVVATYELKGKPYDICVVGDEEVAASVSNQTNIQILSVKGDVIVPVRTMATRYRRSGIAPVGSGEIILVGDSDNNTYCCSLIRDGIVVRYFSHYGSAFRYFRYVALNNSKTRVYVTVSYTNSLHCFNMEGKMQYTYNPDNLKFPLGVAVDRDDNIYVVGYESNNIHQLSPEGCNLQVITTGVPHHPRAISFDKSRDRFIITNDTDTECRKIHIYQLK